MAEAEITAINADCRGQRAAGREALERCRGPRIRAAYREARHPYMDLIDLALTQQLVIAQRFDRGEITDAEAEAAVADVRARVNSEISRRDADAAASYTPPRLPIVCSRIGATTICQ